MPTYTPEHFTRNRKPWKKKSPGYQKRTDGPWRTGGESTVDRNRKVMQRSEEVRKMVSLQAIFKAYDVDLGKWAFLLGHTVTFNILKADHAEELLHDINVFLSQWKPKPKETTNADPEVR